MAAVRVLFAPCPPSITLFSGAGYISGLLPSGIVTVASVPGARWIEVRHRRSRAVIKTVFSNADGTYLFHGLNPLEEYDLIGRDSSGTYNDVIVSRITPSTNPLILEHAPDPIIGVPYSFTYAMTYGTAPASWALTGSPPSGLSFSGATISGTPTGTVGAYSWTVTVTDAASRTRSIVENRTLVLLPLTISGHAPISLVGAAYSYQYTIAGGEGPYTASITSGALPAGLSISASGLLSGTPTTAGTSSFTIGVADIRSSSASVSDSTTVTPTSKARWRVRVLAANSSPNYGSMQELEFRASAGGANQCIGGTPAASSYYSPPSFFPSLAFDGDTTSSTVPECWAADGVEATPWLGYVFASPVSVNQIAIYARAASLTQTPKDFVIESSYDGGSTWQLEWSVSGQTAWGSHEMRTFDRP